MRYRFRPAITPTVITVVVVPALCVLGFWQLDRANQKEQVMNLFNERLDAPAVILGSDQFDPQEIDFRRVSAHGRWDVGHQFLLDNRVFDGRVGYEVITPLILTNDGTVVLVNRGWVAGDPDRRKLPVVEPENPTSTVTGLAIVPPEQPFVLEESQPLGVDWELVWQNIELDRFSEAVEYEIFPFVILLDDEHDASYSRNWQIPEDVWIKRHRAYAVQWFALAGIMLIIYLAASNRRDQ